MFIPLLSLQKAIVRDRCKSNSRSLRDDKQKSKQQQRSEGVAEVEVEKQISPLHCSQKT
jgi:hypothetical protein